MGRFEGGLHFLHYLHHSLLLLSHFSRVQLCVTPEMVAHQAPLSLGFSRKEHWSGLPFPSPMHESESESEVTQSCPTLRDLMDCSPPGSSVHGIFRARVLEWGAIAFSAIIVWSQVNNREGTQPHPSTENCITDLWSIFLPIRARPSFPLSQSLPSGSFHRPLNLLHQRADRLKTTITEN